MNSPELANDTHALVICEGTAEEVIAKKLRNADRLIIASANIIEVTRTRSAKQIQSTFLSYDFDWPVCIIRILDSPHEAFTLDSLYRDRFPIYSFYTRPEVEILAIIRENRYQDYIRKCRNTQKPSEYRKSKLGMHRIKERAFLETYWDPDSIIAASIEYKRLRRPSPREYCLADLISLT